MNLLPPRPAMERAFLAGDAEFDGLFFTGVRTTGIFCRPSCPARKPKPENCEFFATVKEAMFAGYRACKRCDPMGANGRPPEWVATLLARLDAEPESRLQAADLRALGVEPARVRRWFQQHHGMTFAAFCRARRLGRALGDLRAGASLDDAALGHGFESHSGFRDAFAKRFGITPGRARGGDCIMTALIESPVGPLLAGATEQGICLLEFTDRRMIEAQLATVGKRLGKALVPGEHPLLARLKAELAEYFAGVRRDFTVPLVAPGTGFQESVWAELRRIPYGTTISYEELALRTGRPGAQRAVGTANGMNRIAIVIPCHRVVNKSGELGGYGGGLWRKKLLLELERTHRPLAK
jgi:AraC family transcriptional regulator, regulatory protein of adaptative response / methylated-DNA-[protein]-cysteine methyltransferase